MSNGKVNNEGVILSDYIPVISSTSTYENGKMERYGHIFYPTRDGSSLCGMVYSHHYTNTVKGCIKLLIHEYIHKNKCKKCLAIEDIDKVHN